MRSPPFPVIGALPLLRIQLFVASLGGARGRSSDFTPFSSPQERSSSRTHIRHGTDRTELGKPNRPLQQQIQANRTTGLITLNPNNNGPTANDHGSVPLTFCAIDKVQLRPDTPLRLGRLDARGYCARTARLQTGRRRQHAAHLSRWLTQLFWKDSRDYYCNHLSARGGAICDVSNYSQLLFSSTLAF